MNQKIKKHTNRIKELFGLLFERYLDDLEKENAESAIFRSYLRDISEDYIAGHKKEEIVRDFIAGMTDRYFLMQCPAKLRPLSEAG
jgi:dGTPase